ncbi:MULTISPECIES: LIC12628 family protein [Leptospira]|uniref:Uncharacterized protein n=1 Tax=Leptospira santarosai TaxID=28183 RepID=A0AB73MC28_9LEPT|nr:MULTISPECIES: hypothetical protein [Leptospira]ASV12723.1 hypothetical protein B2G51_14890 [Leptospira santarosai]MBW9234058.1 hypothetical protein [Leptospira santarosai]MDI7165730.1 hypothetical protein [Leptospira santarosai]MDI7184222.1 hypothetical protein [Leptospira santarosai]MDI7196171.1 hypothetical protein [Leptospira santarosai]
MIISWEKIRHQYPKEEWIQLLEKVDVIQEKRGSSHNVSQKHPRSKVRNSFILWRFTNRIEKNSNSS